MLKHFLTIIMTVMALESHGAEMANIDSLYRVLDAAIDSADYYLQQKTDRIAHLKDKLRKAASDKEQYDCALNIHREYAAFDNDSAIAYIYQCIDLSEKMGREDLKYECTAGLAYQLANSGFYNEAIIHFDEIPQECLKGDLLDRYESGMNHLYGEMGYYSHDPRLSKLFHARARKIREGLLQRLDSTSSSWYALKSMMLNNANQPEQALRYSDKWMKSCKPGSRRYAIMAFNRSEIYRKTGDPEMQRYWLTQAAIIDIRNAIMDQGALWSLANSLIRDEGDLNRAYRYMDFSWSCISHFSTHMRSWLVSPILTRINDAYKTKLETANSRLSWTVVIISLLAVLLLLLLVYVSKKRKELAIARDKLSKSNDQLSEANCQLSALNNELKQSNLELHDSNRVKDEYITKFFSVCSCYIDKLENYRIKVNRKVKAKQYNDLLKFTNSDQMKEDELKELFNNFDEVFLGLFPTFVDDFNALLREEERIDNPEPGKLTTDLRIFALIRLGIDESSRIAEFLRYSPNSIYNYRARIKNKAAGDRDDFELKVKEIGISTEAALMRN